MSDLPIDGNILERLHSSVRMRSLRADVSKAQRIYSARPELLPRLRQVLARAAAVDAAVSRFPKHTLGQVPLALIDAALPDIWDFRSDIVLFCGEPNKAVVAELQRVGQERIMVAPDTAGVYDTVRRWTTNAPERLCTFMSSDIDKDVALSIKAEVERAIGDGRVFRNTVTTFSHIWVPQAIANLPAVAGPSIQHFDGVFAGKPMIIAAPGPSLSKNVQYLREAKGKAIILAFSHSVAALQGAGVDPDIVMTVDASELTYHFDGCDMSKVPLSIAGVTCHPDLFKLPTKHHATCASNSYLDDWVYAAVGDNARVFSGGSVACTAFSLAQRWKCEPIVLVGLDLSFSDGKYYADTSCDSDMRVKMHPDGKSLVIDGQSDGYLELEERSGMVAPTRTPTYMLPGYYGEDVPSTFSFKLFYEWFCTQKVTTKVYNCTEGGVNIPQFENRPLRDVVTSIHTSLNVSQVVDSVALFNECTGRREKVRAQAEHALDALRNWRPHPEKLLGCGFISISLANQLRIAVRTDSYGEAFDELANEVDALAETLCPLLQKAIHALS